MTQFSSPTLDKIQNQLDQVSRLNDESKTNILPKQKIQDIQCAIDSIKTDGIDRKKVKTAEDLVYRALDKMSDRRAEEHQKKNPSAIVIVFHRLPDLSGDHATARWHLEEMHRQIGVLHREVPRTEQLVKWLIQGIFCGYDSRVPA